MNKSNFWLGKKVLVTGHTGFKGSWLSLWLQKLGAEVIGVSLKANTSPNLFELVNLQNGLVSHICDVRDKPKLFQIIRNTNPEIVFHLSAQPLVRASYKDPLDTFSTNLMGTANVLDALRGLDSVKVAVMITTDKVYLNNESNYPYRETDILGGHDPYSSSKAASEIIIASYRDSFLANQGVSIASARAGNVIGGGDWSEDRLIPDAIRAWTNNSILNIRNPNSVRPWQHVLEPLEGYLILAQKLWHNPKFSGAFNFGPDNSSTETVNVVIQKAIIAFGSGEVSYDSEIGEPHESTLLSLDTSKTVKILGVSQKWSLSETVKRTMLWYKNQNQGFDARLLCETEISDYESIK